MEMEGNIWKEGRFWIVEVPTLDAMTQGKTRKEALLMIEDLILEMVRSYFSEDGVVDLKLTVTDYKKGIIGVASNNNKLLLALSLKRNREKSRSTVREAAERLGSTSPNAYAQYEKGRIRISLDKYEQLLKAANPDRRSLMRVI